MVNVPKGILEMKVDNARNVLMDVWNVKISLNVLYVIIMECCIPKMIGRFRKVYVYLNAQKGILKREDNVFNVCKDVKNVHRMTIVKLVNHLTI